MCVAGYWVDLDTDCARHFETLTALVFAVVGTIYLGVIVSASAADPDPAAAEPAPPAASRFRGNSRHKLIDCARFRSRLPWHCDPDCPPAA